VNFDDISDSCAGKSGGNPKAISVKLQDRRIVDCLVFLVALHFGDKFLKDTEGDNETKGNHSGERGISLNFGNALHNSGYAIENIHHLGELNSQGDREEVPPGVARRAALVARVVGLTRFNMLLVVEGGHVMRELEALRLQKFNLTSFTSFIVFTHLLVIDNLMKTKSGQNCLFYLDMDHSYRYCRYLVFVL